MLHYTPSKNRVQTALILQKDHPNRTYFYTYQTIDLTY
jgi:hypothetical protein